MVPVTPRLTYENRKRIKYLLVAGFSVPEIAREIGVHHDTIYQELKRCGSAAQYDPDAAETQAAQGRKRQNNLPAEGTIFSEDADLARLVSALILDDGMNVQQVIRWLQQERPERFKRLPKSRNTIFAAIDSGLIPGVTRDTLKTRTVRLFSGDLVHIPQWVIRQLELCDGDEFSIELRGAAIILKKKD